MNSHTDNAAHRSNSKGSSNSNNKTIYQPPNDVADQKLDHDTDSQLSTSSVSPLSSNGSIKSHKIEGKNKKSLHHKQQQQNQANLSQQRANHQNQQQNSQAQQQQPHQQSASSNRRTHQKNSNGPSKVTGATSSNTLEPANICSSLNEFSKRAQDLKADINRALEKQATHQNTDQPLEVVKLKEDILKLSGLKSVDNESASTNSGGEKSTSKNLSSKDDLSHIENDQVDASVNDTQPIDGSHTNDTDDKPCNTSGELTQILGHNESSQMGEDHKILSSSSQKDSRGEPSCETNKTDSKIEGYKSDTILTRALDKLKLDEQDGHLKRTINKPTSKKQRNQSQTEADNYSATYNNINRSNDNIISDEFEPLDAKLDLNSKLVALKSSLQKHFNEAPHLLEPISLKLVNMSEQNGQLKINCEKYQSEIQKLTMVKQKLENLCRELQKSNNAIRIESLDLIKVEQGKAKEQTTKIQSTLSGVIKLFDENQQRNMSLRQENQELQTKLKSLLDHCDNWEKSVEASLRQRDIENRLLKTELAKANLLKNEEKEKFLGEKQELLQILSMMQEQQHRIEGQEAKLRSDLSSYASKYDECQAVISKGMNRFQTESKKMLKQIERSKQDYKVLLSKYESSNKRMAQLLEEKQYWHRAINLANKKIETLERLCRALRDRKQDGKSDNPNVPINQKSNKATKSNNSPKVSTDQAAKEVGPTCALDSEIQTHILLEDNNSLEAQDDATSSVSLANEDDGTLQSNFTNSGEQTLDKKLMAGDDELSSDGKVGEVLEEKDDTASLIVTR